MSAPVRRGSWIVIVPMAVVAAGYVFFFFVPGNRRIAELREQLTEKQEFLNMATKIPQEMIGDYRELERTKTYLAACRQRVTEEKDLDAVFGRIHREADAAGVRIVRFDPQSPVAYERLRRVPVALSCTGPFPQIYGFLRTIEATPTAIWIESLRLAKDGRQGKATQCDLELAVFVDNPDNFGYAKRTD
jgi:Tfp pilus assembly protein PilO